MDDFITIGQIVKAVGIRGEIKIKPITDDPARFRRLKIVYIKSKPYKIESCRFDGDYVVFKLSGISDRNAAEELRNFFIEIDRVNAVPLEEGSYFIADILGCKLFTDDGEQIGKIVDVSQFGAADVFTVSNGQKTVRFPFLKKMIVKVDVDSGVVIVAKSVFDGVCVYED
ncbi:MAG: ribosome maturation factor RimM [Christensenellales bacterium]